MTARDDGALMRVAAGHALTLRADDRLEMRDRASAVEYARDIQPPVRNRD
jgi:hypothetical protein